MNLKQFKLTNNDEIICEVVDREDASDDDDGIVVRKALRIITSEDFESSIRYYSFKPLVSFQDNIDELVVMNVGHIICETLPSKTLVIHYAKAIKEVEENYEEAVHIGSNAKDFILSNYSAENFKFSFKKIFDTV